MDAVSLPAVIVIVTVTVLAGYICWVRVTYKGRLRKAYYLYKRYDAANFNPHIVMGLLGPRVVKFCPRSMKSYIDHVQDEFGEWHIFRWTTPAEYYKSRRIHN